MIEAHRQFDMKYRLGNLRGSSCRGATLLRLSDSPTLVTAPHSVTQLRAGKEKPAESWTGAMAETLGFALGASVLTALSPRIEEANAASPDPFLRVMVLIMQAQQVRLVLDVHGLAARHDIDINIGTAGFRRPHLISDLAKDLASDFCVTLGRPYNGGNGITGLINEDATNPASAIQLELGPRLRGDATDLDELQRLVTALSRFEAALLAAR